MNVLVLSVINLIIAIVLGTLPFTTTNGLFQNIYLAVASSFFAVFLGLVAINIILNSRDRKSAAAPLLHLIIDSVSKQHNDLFVEIGRNTFGSEEFGRLIDVYQKNKRNAQAFSPLDLNSLYDMIIGIKADLIATYSEIEANSRDMAFILGWAYDPKLLGAILSTRAGILSFIRLIGAAGTDVTTKRAVVEAYLDIDATTHAWVQGLAGKLGVVLASDSR